MSWSMWFLGFSMWVFGEAERCEVVPRHPYKPSWLYGLFVRWHETSEKRIYFFYPLLSSFLPVFFFSLFLIFSLRSILFLFLLTSALCLAVLLLDEFGPFPSSLQCFLTKKNFDKSSTTKWKAFCLLPQR